MTTTTESEPMVKNGAWREHRRRAIVQAVAPLLVIIALLFYIGYTVNESNRRADHALSTSIATQRFDVESQVAAQCRNALRDRFLSDIAALAATTSRPIDASLFKALADDHASLAAESLDRTCPYPSPPKVEGR